MPDISAEDLSRVTGLILEKYGYDFRNYAISSFKRRVLRMMELKNITLDELLDKLSTQSSFLNEFLNELTVNVTEMFRDHDFWKVLRDEIIPSILLTQPPFSIWHAGCSSGEEVLSMMILLAEMGIHEQVKLVASDLDSGMLEKARSGSCSIKHMDLNERNYLAYLQAEGTLKKYYHEENGRAVFARGLLKNVSFLEHDLVTGDMAGRFDLILCRNVMIYFNQALQNDVLKKFHRSLAAQGYLAIGTKESLIWCDIASKFSIVSSEQKIYRKIKD